MDQRYQDRDNVHASTHKIAMTHMQDKVWKQNAESLPLKNGAAGRTVGSHTHICEPTHVFIERHKHVLTFTHARIHTCSTF